MKIQFSWLGLVGSVAFRFPLWLDFLIGNGMTYRFLHRIFGRNWKKKRNNSMISFQMAFIMLMLCSLEDEQSLRKWLFSVFIETVGFILLFASNDPCTVTVQLKQLQWMLACQSVYGYDYLTELLFNVLLLVLVLRCWYLVCFNMLPSVIQPLIQIR